MRPPPARTEETTGATSSTGAAPPSLLSWWLGAPTIEERLGQGARSNNFDTLRLIASSAVLLSHAFPVGEGIGTAEPMSGFTHGTTLGSLAVAAFFVFSGLLVTNSAERTKTVRRFARARFLRIFPGLATLMLVTMLLIGPLMTRLPLAEYFSSAVSWDYLQGVYLRFRTTLPGLFESNPYPVSVNNSLWSLRIEVAFYLMTGVLLAVQLLNKWTSVGLFLISLLFVRWVGPHLPNAGLMTLAKSAMGVAPYYLVGACLYFFRRNVRLSIPLAVAATVAWVLSNLFQILQSEVTAIAGSYILLVLALSPAVRLPRPFGDRDLSYGVYLYGWPLQQCVAVCLGATPWYVNAALSFAVVLPVAYASWTLIEKPVLSLKTPVSVKS